MASPQAHDIATSTTPTSESSERPRRRVESLEVDVPAHLVDYESTRARCTSLSLGGMFLETDQRLEVGSDVHVCLDLPAGLSLLVTATVRWRTARGVGLNIGLSALAKPMRSWST